MKINNCDIDNAIRLLNNVMIANSSDRFIDRVDVLENCIELLNVVGYIATLDLSDPKAILERRLEALKTEVR